MRGFFIVSRPKYDILETMSHTRKFTIITLFFAILLGVILDYTIASLLRNQVIDLTRSQIADLVQIHAMKEFDPLHFSPQNPEEVREAFSEFYNDIHLSHAVRIKVWDTSGRIIFFDDPSLIGKSFPENEKFRTALRGEVPIQIQEPLKSENISEAGYSQLMEVYVPIFFSKERGGRIVGIIEVYFSLDNVNSLINQARVLIALAAFFVAFAYWASVMMIFRRIIYWTTLDLEKFKLVAEYASDHLVLTDSEGVILYANKAAERVTGYTRKEIVGSRPSLWGGQMGPEFYQNLWHTIKDKKRVFGGEIENRRKTGEKYIAQITITPIVKKGAVEFFIGIERDITKEKELNQMRNDFMALASHQLRTPLSGTKWLINTLQKGILGVLTERQKTYLDTLYTINEKMIGLVSDMLNILRWENGGKAVMETVDVDSIFNELLIKFTPVAKNRGVILKSGFSGRSGWKLKTSRQFLGSILENILSNAITYSQTGQKVTFNISEEDAALVFTVRDSGIGIPWREQGKIFDRFYRASNALNFKPEGTGLGLPMAAMLAEKIGAAITFQSEENKGSVFFVRVPKTMPEPQKS